MLAVSQEAVKNKHDAGIKVREIDEWVCLIPISSEASWANAEDLSSIAGYLIYMAAPEALT